MIKMPWNNATAPNLMLEVTDSCNVHCDVCYKKRGSTFKSIPQIQAELDIAMELRNLHTITISGGEPTLHPDLDQIIAMIKKQNLHVFLLTNGLCITYDYLAKLKDSGLDSILYHVDIGQNRSDLPENPVFKDIKKRLKELTAMAASLGVDVSISMTLYEGLESFFNDLTDLFFNSPDMSFLFVARAFDFTNQISDQRGKPDHDSLLVPGVNNICQFFQANYNVESYSYIPSSDPRHSCWVSFFVPIIYSKNRRSFFRIKSNVTDSWLMEIPRKLTGSYIHKTTQKPSITFLRVLINALSTFRLLALFRFCLKLFHRSSILRHKMIVYDDGPFLNENGQVVHCQYCPTAIVREGTMVSCCVADYDISKGKPHGDSLNVSTL